MSSRISFVAVLAALLVLLFACGPSSAPAPSASGTGTPVSGPAVAGSAAATVERSPAAGPLHSTPSPASPATVAPTATAVYEVQPGDTVYDIALKFYVTVDDIVKANNLADPSHVEVGQKLVIPQHEATSPQPTVMPSAAPAGDTPPQADRIPILMYHHVRELQPGANALDQDLTVLPANFKEQMGFLVSRGYTTVGLKDLVDAAQGQKALPPKPIILTFDDGYADAYADVFPILKDHKYVGTFYLLSGTVGYPEYMTWEQAKEMSDAGMDMEAHGIAHLDLTQISASDAREQIATSKRDIEARLGKPVTSYCYPSGKYNAGTLDLLRESGYLAAVTTKPGMAEITSPLLELPRVRIHGSTDIGTFAALLGESG